VSSRPDILNLGLEMITNNHKSMFLYFILNRLDSNRSAVFQGIVYFLIFAFSAIVSTLPLLFEGVQSSVDSQTFMACAELFLEQGTFIQSLYENFHRPWCRLYTTYLWLLSTIVSHYGQNWALAIAVINIFFHALAITSISILTSLVTKKISLALAVALLLTFSVDVLIRVNWPLSDSLFFFTATLAFVITASTFFRAPTPFVVLTSLASLLAAGLSRPHGLAIFLLGLVTLCSLSQVGKLTPKVGFAVIGFVVGGLLLSFLLVSLIFGPNYTPITTEDGILWEYQLTGQVIDGVFSTYNSGTESYWVRLGTILERFVTFFSFFPSHWSVRHVILSSVFFVPWYVGFVGCWIAFSQKALDPRIRSLILFSTSWLISIAAFAGWFTITYEHRYRLSIMAILAFQAVLGIHLMISPKGIFMFRHRTSD